MAKFLVERSLVVGRKYTTWRPAYYPVFGVEWVLKTKNTHVALAVLVSMDMGSNPIASTMFIFLLKQSRDRFVV